MEVNYLSFGNITLRVESTEKLLETEVCRDFFCREKPYDFVLNCSFAKKTIEPPNRLASAETESKLVFLNGENLAVYYKAAKPGEFFAVREYDGKSEKINITFTEKARGRLWTRLVLNTAGIEELAPKKGGVIFHSSFIEKEKTAVLFTGKCGIGKSTQALLWNKYRNTPIINGDKTLIYFENGEIFASGLPFSGSSKISENRSMPLGMIVNLGKSKKNVITALSPHEAFLCLMKSSYVPPYCNDEISKILAEIAQKASFCSLLCTPDERAVKTLELFMKGRENFEL